MFNSANIAAIFLFNHKFERNIDALERLYSDRFPVRKYIMPFASRSDEQVLRVYEASWNFSGHIAQAASSFIDPSISHYVIIADDLILNPKIDATNIVETLGIDDGSAYIKSLIPADNLRYRWVWSGESAMAMRKFGRGFDYRSELPPATEARRKFEAMGLTFEKPLPRSLRQIMYGLYDTPKVSAWAFAMGLGVVGRRAEYPLLSGYSDFCVVPASGIEAFVHYCGVFAAMNVFAEVAVPTALALAVDTVKTELPLGHHFMDEPRSAAGVKLKGIEFWKAEAAVEFADRADRKLDRLVSTFPEDWLYVHPVKLSAFS